MILAALLAIAAAHGAHAPAPVARPKLVVLDVAGKDPAFTAPARAALGAALVQESVRFESVEVTSMAEIRAALKLAAERAQIGCDDDSCAAELADAYGARFVLFSSVARVGSTWSLALSLYDSHGSRVVGRGTADATTLSALTAEIGGPVEDALASLGSAKKRARAEVAPARGASPAGGPALLDKDDVALAEEPLDAYAAAPCKYDEAADRYSCGGAAVDVPVARSGSAATAGSVRFRVDLGRGCPSLIAVDVDGGDEGATVTWLDAAAEADGTAVPLKGRSGLSTPVSIPAHATGHEEFLPAGGCLGAGDPNGAGDVVSVTLPFLVGRNPARATWVRRRAREPRSEHELLALVPQPDLPAPPPDAAGDDPPLVIFTPLGAGAGVAAGTAGGAVAGLVLMPKSSDTVQRLLVGAGFGVVCAACVGLPAGIGGGFADYVRAKSWEDAQAASSQYRAAEKRLAAWKRRMTP